jgi:dTMP kinase
MNTLHIGTINYAAVGYNFVLLLSAGIAVWLGAVSYRQMDDRAGVPLRDDLIAVLRGEPFRPVPAHPNGSSLATATSPAARRGLLIALEGGEGADRAEHVESVIVPALARGAIVVTDRYVDSSIAYQGRGRNQPVGEVAGLNEWATDGMVPDLTILLDLPPGTGLGRRTPSADRLEAEPVDFHERVREGFLAQARAAPGRYLVLDATQPPEEISRQIQDRLRDMLPDPVPPSAEDSTGSFPAIVE